MKENIKLKLIYNKNKICEYLKYINNNSTLNYTENELTYILSRINYYLTKDNKFIEILFNHLYGPNFELKLIDDLNYILLANKEIDINTIDKEFINKSLKSAEMQVYHELLEDYNTGQELSINPGIVLEIQPYLDINIIKS